MKFRPFRHPLPASLWGVRLAAFAVAISPASALAGPLQSVPATRPSTVASPTGAPASQATQSPAAPATQPNQGIVYLTATPDSVLIVKTGAGVVTRVSLPEVANSAICGDLYDPATNAGSFIINREENDVYIKPVPKANTRSNLFVRTDKNVYNFDLVVVPADQAHRVVNVNLPSYEKDIEIKTEARLKELETQYQTKTTELEAIFQARSDALERENAAKLEEDRKNIRVEVEQRVNELLTTRFADGVLVGFTRLPLAERSGKLGPVSVTLEPEALTFEGRLYVKYRITNNTADEVVYLEPRVALRALSEERNAPIVAEIFTADGILRVPPKDQTTGVVVFEQPTLTRGDRIVLTFRGEDVERMQLQLNILSVQ